VRSLLKKRITEQAESQAASYGGKAVVEYIEGYPVVINSDAETDFAVQVARELVGDDKVVEQTDILMGSEDFAFMLQKRPGTFLRIGNGAGEDGCMVHNPHYDFNDRNLPVGAHGHAIERGVLHELFTAHLRPLLLITLTVMGGTVST
ncbi:M20/M25/M40 family metallo-hydrolase, partial [Escherichia coli]|nr:M20/M25/M40 family metallo-hydrolase [Escherichia coli]